ncbi:sigma-w pathway protein ysdB [Niallia sp. XMNu-256]|uniref:sigma-w pathway protein ysdB n=1 Tax=Niallia sp. XMNu-256 TaxID=3082444 RepID=UPI0030D48923
MLWVIRLILLVIILFAIYRIILYLSHPRRKLELAREQQRYYFYDDPTNVRKNFLLTYKGVLFEGEKYLDPIKKSFNVVSISMIPQQVIDLSSFIQDDFHLIEQKIHEQYPNAIIDWKSPVKEFLHSHYKGKG